MRKNTRKVICRQRPGINSVTCGTENPASMECPFYELEGGEVATVFTPKLVHEGQLNIMHGGLTAAVLDELMGRSVLAHYRSKEADDQINECDEEFTSRCVTAEMTTKYKKPIIIGRKIFGYGRIVRSEGRRTYATSELLNEDGEIVALAEAVFVEVKVPKEILTDQITDSEKHLELTEKDPKEL